ncbi:hypothetical protein [Alkalibacillus silvisoli]|uniref:Phage protein n=1 Tax=Alkalibacillus silvisoli TaxID=392823 RepID=A0ABN1AC58_9BACI
MTNVTPKFNFKKPEQKFNINGQEYLVDLSDEALNKYQRVAVKYTDFADEAQEVDLVAMTDDEYEDFQKRSYEASKEVLDALFGEGAFDELYEASGQSMHNMAEVVKFMFDWLTTNKNFKADK